MWEGILYKHINVLILAQNHFINSGLMENQDGGVGRHIVPPQTTRTDRKSNSKEVNTEEIKNKHASRPVGGVEMGTGMERTHVAMAGPRLAECETNGAGSPTTSRPSGPTFAHR